MGKIYLRQLGIPIPKNFDGFTNRHFRGVSQKDINRILKKKFRIPDSLNAMHRRRMDILLGLFQRNLRPMPGAVNTVKRLSRKYLLALVSSSPRESVDFSLKLLRIRRIFRTIVTGEHVRHAKPAPDIFLLATRRLRIRPEHCIVIEDSIAGLNAAHRAGVRCIILKTRYSTRAQLTQADGVVRKLGQLPRMLSNVL